MSEPTKTPIFDLGKILATAEAKKADDPKDTSITFSLDATKTFGVEVEHQHTGDKLVWSLSGWVKRTPEPGSLSAGVKGKIAFD